MNPSSASTERKIPLYEEVANRISYLVEEGTFRPGDRVPSIRNLSQQFGVSINTIKQAYAFLEDRRMIEARPQSGYFVCARLPEATPGSPNILVIVVDTLRADHLSSYGYPHETAPRIRQTATAAGGTGSC